MPHMIPQYSRDPFFVIETTAGQECIPAEVVGADGDLTPFLEGAPEAEPERIEGSYFARLSAPGYLDATDWSGPFTCRTDAEDWVREMWDIDPKTGESLEDDS